MKALNSSPQTHTVDEDGESDRASPTCFEDFAHRASPEDETHRSSPRSSPLILKLLDAIDERDATRPQASASGSKAQEPLTLKQIGGQIGLTRERVRQIEIAALDKLNKRLNDERPTRFIAPAAGAETAPRSERTPRYASSERPGDDAAEKPVRKKASKAKRARSRKAG